MKSDGPKNGCEMKKLDDSKLSEIVERAAALYASIHITNRPDLSLELSIYLANLANKIDSAKLRDISDVWVRSSSAKILKDDGNFSEEDVREMRCDFCGKDSTEVALAAGASGLICHNCVDALHKSFQNE